MNHLFFGGGQESLLIKLGKGAWPYQEASLQSGVNLYLSRGEQLSFFSQHGVFSSGFYWCVVFYIIIVSPLETENH